jgi:hypothetical protein
MEIISRSRKILIWLGRDAEGRFVYAANRPGPDGIAIEPSQAYHYSRKAAIAAFLEEAKDDRQRGN